MVALQLQRVTTITNHTGDFNNLSLLLVVAFSSLARISEECSTIHSPPTVFLFCFLKWRLTRTH